MKTKSIFIIFVVFHCWFSGNSQNSIGIITGPNFGKTFYNYVGNETTSHPPFKVGFSFGLGYDRILCESFTFALYGRYSKAHTSVHFDFVMQDLNFSMEVIDLPAQIRYRLGKSNVNVALGIGPAWSKMENLNYRWNLTGLGGLVTDYDRWNIGLDANYLFRNISEIFFQNGNPIGKSGQKLFYIHLYGKYSFGI